MRFDTPAGRLSYPLDHRNEIAVALDDLLFVETWWWAHERNVKLYTQIRDFGSRGDDYDFQQFLAELPLPHAVARQGVPSPLSEASRACLP